MDDDESKRERDQRAVYSKKTHTHKHKIHIENLRPLSILLSYVHIYSTPPP